MSSLFGRNIPWLFLRQNGKFCWAKTVKKCEEAKPGRTFEGPKRFKQGRSAIRHRLTELFGADNVFYTSALCATADYGPTDDSAWSVPFFLPDTSPA